MQEKGTKFLEYLSQLVISQPINEPEFKTIIKQVQTQQNVEHLEQCSSIMETHLKSLENVTESERTESELWHVLKFFRLFAEDPTCKITKILCPVDNVLLFSKIIFPRVTSIIQCSKAEGHASEQKSASLLQKTVRLTFNLIKAITAEGKGQDGPNTTANNKAEELIEIGMNFLNLLNNHPDAKLEIKFNVGLALCHLVSRKFIENLLCTKEQVSTTDEPNQITNSSLEEAVLIFVRADYVYTLGLCFGALMGKNISTKLMSGIAHLALAQSEKSIKEAENFGAARVLETWMNKVVSDTSVQLEELSNIFPMVEIFIFTYLQGHIDAVKMCSRNMLTDLTRVYHRLDKENVLLKDLFKRILTKPFHIKWVALAAVSRNPESVAILDVWKNAAEELLCADRIYINAASEVYIALLRYSFNSTPDKISWIKAWVSPLFRIQPSPRSMVTNWPQKKYILTKVMSATESGSKVSNEKSLQQVILTTVIDALSISTTSYSTLPSPTQSSSLILLSTESSCLVIECIKIGTDFGINPDLSSISTIDTDLFRGVLPRSIFNAWTSHANPQIRLAAFSIIVETKKTSEIFTVGDFETLKRIFRYNLASQNPAFRQEFLACYKKLLRRLKDGKSLATRSRRQEDVDNYKNFMQWLWNFFINEGLFVGANFSRRYQSLTCVSELLKHFKIGDLLPNADSPHNYLTFIRWLNDSYEQNKIAATDILTQLPIPSFEDEQFCKDVSNRTMNLLVSVKPSDSVAGRYLLYLLLKKSSSFMSAWKLIGILMTKLEGILESIKETSLFRVSTTTPPYGVIRAIRLILETHHKEILKEASSFSTNNENSPSFKNLQIFTSRLLKCSLEINSILMPVLGSSAPEGFLPDFNENPENSNIVRSINSQMLLVSSWRSMKELCILLTELCGNFPFQGEMENEDQFALSFEDVSSIGTHLVFLLMNLMHRGVFEQVFVGFKSLAARLKKSKVSQYNKLSEMWLEEVMDKDKVGDKCTTRRSAGLPFIFQALLIPESNNETFMNYWIEKLMQPDPAMTVRIHSMNIVRGLFRDGNFSLMEWIPRGLQLAFHGLRASEWAERNSGLMLFGSVIRRTFGPRLNLMSAPTFFRKFPNMYSFLLAELKATTTAASANEATQHDNDLLYHLLLLFSCFSSTPGKLEEGQFKLGEFVPFIQACGANRDIQVRNITARAIVPFITTSEDRNRVLENTLDNLLVHSKKLRNNRIHGDLLQICAILKLVKSYNEEIPVNLIEKFQVIIDIVKNTRCPTIFENFAHLSISLADFNQQNLMSTALTMQKVTELACIGMFPNSNELSRRNVIVGLPEADSAVCKSIVRFESNEENISRWIQEGNQCIVDELLVKLISGFEPSPVSGGFESNLILDDGTNSKLQHNKSCGQDINFKGKLSSANNVYLIKRYLQEEFHFQGTDIELNYLLYFSNCDVQDFQSCSDMEMKRVMDKLVVICQADFGTIPCKATALKFLSRLAFRANNENKQVSRHKEIVCELFVQWSDSDVDDELRLAVASSLPNVPLRLDQFFAMEFCKIWTALFKLAQDDETRIRRETLKRLSSDNQVPGCSLKCLELLVQVFLEQLNTRSYTIEGLWTLFGWLLKDDFVVTNVVDDDEEDRLFDRSEMNLFGETVTLTNIVVQYLESQKETLEYFKSQLSTSLCLEGYQFFELITNLPMSDAVHEDCDQSNFTILTKVLAEQKVDDIEQQEEKENENLLPQKDNHLRFVDLLCANNSDNILVQRLIREKIIKLFFT